MTYVQMELFEISEMEKLKSHVRVVERTVDNVRRGLFSRHDDLEKKYMDLRDEVEKLSNSLQTLFSQIKNYKEVAGPVSPLFSTLRSTLAPISVAMTSSHASSTGLSLPR
jgi:hypothetical protein